MSRRILDITVEDFANSNSIASNVVQTDRFGSRLNGDIILESSIVPQTDSIYQIGNSDSRLISVHTNNITSNTLRPENLETITFFGNLCLYE